MSGCCRSGNVGAQLKLVLVLEEAVRLLQARSNTDLETDVNSIRMRSAYASLIKQAIRLKVAQETRNEHE